MATGPNADLRPATPLVEPRFGLVAAARRFDNLSAVRWGNGVVWLPELHPDTSEAYGARALKCNVADVGHGSDDRAALEYAHPFAVYAFDWCTTLEARDYEGRARRLLLATQSRSIAAEFWSGTIVNAETSLTNTWLASATDLATASAIAPAKALAKLDAAVCSALSNGRGMIHCTVEVLNRLMSDDAVRLDGNQWVTASGNVVVSDAGYTGDRDGQAGNTEWMVGTSTVELTLGEIRTYSLQTEEGRRMAVRSDVNDVKVWCERDVLVMHEPNLCLIAAQVDLS